MKKQTVTAFTIAFSLITLTLIDTTGYTAPPLTEPDAKAISLVRAALTLSNPANPKTARIHAEGNMRLNNQGLNPQQSTRTQHLSADWKVDFQNRRFLQRSANHSDSASTKVMAAIHEIAPGKPIRYIVPTHFHEDHIGGLRAYLREGATVVTTPGNLRFVEMLMKKLKATEPQVKLPAVEVISDKRRFSDGIVALDLLNVPNPHVDEMVVPFVPSDGIVYVADGLTRDFGPWRRPTIDERILVRQFKQLGLDIRMVLPGHGSAASQKDLEQYWRLMSEPVGSISKRGLKRTAVRTPS